MQVFRAMTTEVAVAAPALTAPAEHALACRIAAVFHDTERRFSRFRADSELGRLNRARGPIEVSAELMALLCAARDHVAASDGLFDPAIGAALCAAGYDRSVDRASGAAGLDRDAPAATVPRARFAELVLDERARRVERPPHLHLDLAGFLKGRTVDRAAALAPANAMIEAGGDGVLRGAGPDGAGWWVDVEDPRDARRVLVTIRARDRAVATSAPNRRRWRVGPRTAHHLIDPRTGRPSTSDLAQVTVVAATAERADVLAKVAFLRGRADAARWLAGQPGVGGVLVGTDGAWCAVGDLELDDA